MIERKSNGNAIAPFEEPIERENLPKRAVKRNMVSLDQQSVAPAVLVKKTKISSRAKKMTINGKSLLEEHHVQKKSMQMENIVPENPTSEPALPKRMNQNLRTIDQFITTTFVKQLKTFHESEFELKIGDAILARMTGFKPWPSKILGFKNNSKIIECYFFGTNNKGPVGSKNVIPFADAFDTIRLVCLLNLPSYAKGIREIEYEFGVPNELSCLRENNAIE